MVQQWLKDPKIILALPICIYPLELPLSRMLLKRGTGSGERGAGNGEGKSGNELSAETAIKIQNGGPKNEREKEEDKERNSIVPWLKSDGDEIANQTHILRLRFEQVVCFFDIQPVSIHLQYDKVLGLSFRDTWHTHIAPGLLRLL